MSIKFKNRFLSLLRLAEKHTKTDVIYLTKGGFWLSLGHVFAMFSGFLMSIAFANLFPKEFFGTYKFILSVTGLIGVFSLTGLGSAITQSVVRGFGNSLFRGFRINLKWGIGTLLAGITLSIYYFVNDNTILSFSFLLAGILSPIISSANLYGAYLLGKKDFKRTSLYGTIQTIAPTIIIITTLFFSKNLFVIIIAYFSSTFITPLFLYIRTKQIYKKENNREDPNLLSYGKHLSIMEIIARVAGQLDKILIFHYLGAAPLAIYSFAIAPVEQLQGGKKILSTLIKPKLGERSFEELQKSTPRKGALLIIASLILAGIYAFLAPYFYQIFFPQYLDSVFYSQIYSLTLLAIGGTVFQETLLAHKKTKELYFLRTIVPVTQLVLFFFMLPLYGLMGLIITHVIMRSFSSVVSYYLVKRPFSIATSN